MTAFEDKIDASVGSDGQTLIDLAYSTCWHYALPSYDLRIWRGGGKLITTGGVEWLGSIDQNGVDHHVTPSIADGRDGTSRQLQFKMPYLDAATYLALRDDETEVNGALLKAYLVVFEDGEGLRPQTPIDFLGQFTMQSTMFEEGRRDDGRSSTRYYQITGIAKNGNVGRSQSSRGTDTDATQQQRAEYYGEAPDHGMGFVAELANKTIQPP